MAEDTTQTLSTSQLADASSAELLDEDGKRCTFGEVVSGKRVAVVFIRHFWCTNCQVYTHHLGKSIPPSSLPDGTSVVIIGCGASAPIKEYLTLTSCPYPVYTCPSLALHKTFKFVSNLRVAPVPKISTSSADADAEGKGSACGTTGSTSKSYVYDAGGGLMRAWKGMRNGMKNPSHALESSRGPSAQNGGEMVVEADGTCSFFHRMQYTDDHTPLPVVAEKIGAKYQPLTEEEKREI